jgi:hypothetical protein
LISENGPLGATVDKVAALHRRLLAITQDTRRMEAETLGDFWRFGQSEVITLSIRLWMRFDTTGDSRANIYAVRQPHQATLVTKDIEHTPQITEVG